MQTRPCMLRRAATKMPSCARSGKGVGAQRTAELSASVLHECAIMTHLARRWGCLLRLPATLDLAPVTGNTRSYVVPRRQAS